jgi:hypothetical protein
MGSDAQGPCGTGAVHNAFAQLAPCGTDAVRNVRAQLGPSTGMGMHADLLARPVPPCQSPRVCAPHSNAPMRCARSLLSTPLHALVPSSRYLIAEANYGGRVTDELDRRVLASCLSKLYCEDALEVPGFRLSPLPTYYIPDGTTIAAARDYILTLPATDRCAAWCSQGWGGDDRARGC